jgi:hypothetical protein
MVTIAAAQSTGDEPRPETLADKEYEPGRSKLFTQVGACDDPRNAKK